MSVDDLGSTAQLKVVQLIQGGRGAEFADIAGAPDAIDKISTLNMTFLGVNLSESPTLGVINACFLIAVLSGLSALLMCIIQNKINVLQIEQNKLSVGNDRIHGRFLYIFCVYRTRRSRSVLDGATSLPSL